MIKMEKSVSQQVSYAAYRECGQMGNQSMWLEKLRHVKECQEIPAVWQEDFEERAAILEYDSGLSTADAEAQAKREILARIADLQKGTN